MSHASPCYAMQDNRQCLDSSKAEETKANQAFDYVAHPGNTQVCSVVQHSQHEPHTQPCAKSILNIFCCGPYVYCTRLRWVCTLMLGLV